MARKSRKRENQRVRQRRLYGQSINSILRSEPIIHITDRRRIYSHRRRSKIRKETAGFRKHVAITAAPNRAARKARNYTLQVAFPKVYEKVHNCKKEWGKLLSWRSGQGAGRKRSPRELRNNHSNFLKKDC